MTLSRSLKRTARCQPKVLGGWQKCNRAERSSSSLENRGQGKELSFRKGERQGQGEDTAAAHQAKAGELQLNMTQANIPHKLKDGPVEENTMQENCP